MSAPDLPAPSEQGKALAALLGGKSLTVTDGSMTDLEALVAKLKSDSERTRFLMLMTSLTSIGQSLNAAQKSALESGLALAEKLSELEGDLKGYTDDEAKTKAEMTILEAKIDQLQKLIDQAVEDGKEHNELVAEQKRVREELAAKEQTVADIQGNIAKTKNEISDVKGKISAIVNSVGENTLKTIANELTTLTPPEKPESAEEARKEAEKIAANDPLAAIRDSLDKIERDITDAIQENRIETV
jgi:chromosome segregation ATPase